MFWPFRRRQEAPKQQPKLTTDQAKAMVDEFARRAKYVYSDERLPEDVRVSLYKKGLNAVAAALAAFLLPPYG